MEVFFKIIVVVSSLIFLCFLVLKIGFSSKFLSKFFILGFFILLMVLINLLCIFTQDIIKLGMSLILLSFYSLFLIGLGYGMGEGLSLIILFKVLGDVFITLLIGILLCLKMENHIGLTILGLYKTEIQSILVIIFSIFSLSGVFGFWIYWAMEASYFVSTYIHTSGFIAVGWVLFTKLITLDVLSSEIVQGVIYLTSLISYLFFMSLFLGVKDIKKSFGYFSASSISFLFIVFTENPTLSLVYFFISSLTKVVIFELMGYIYKTKKVGK